MLRSSGSLTHSSSQDVNATPGEEGEPKEQGESHLPLFPQTPIFLSDFLPA